ncbi:hypothetical protein CNYM01_03349 [Colletotrichum nymphaeae SA-01]|uniref:Uncharacterized protein n=1 Tax=Colletotrichum nymphaeae SA-01 TaxID=1460502 RepID=A0A135TRZ9_9PEZI|nr:hypothetical protein CNYM01_03349 [Colletotrichum nymphaeae SA-01]
MQRNFLKTSPLPLSHSTPFACMSLFCPLVVIIIIFAASPSRGQATDTKQVTAPLPAPATTHHLPYVAKLVLIKGSIIAPDSRHISLESFQSPLCYRLARLAGFYLIALLDRGRVSGQHLLLPAVQHSWRATTNHEPSLSCPVLPTSAPYGYKTPRTELAHFEQQQISSAIRTFELTTTRHRLGRDWDPSSARPPVLLFHNGQPCLARPNRLTEGARSKISRQHLATTTQTTSPPPASITRARLTQTNSGADLLHTFGRAQSQSQRIIDYRRTRSLLNPIDPLWNPVDIAKPNHQIISIPTTPFEFSKPFRLVVGGWARVSVAFTLTRCDSPSESQQLQPCVG